MTNHPLFLLSTVESDSHTWNLVYLELLLEEQGIEVVNLGACVPASTTLEALRSLRPDALVISSVNGHGYWQARELGSAAARMLGEDVPPFLIGGKLTTSESDNDSVVGDLRSAGFTEVFVGDGAIQRFCDWLALFKRTVQPRIGRSAEALCRRSFGYELLPDAAEAFPARLDSNVESKNSHSTLPTDPRSTFCIAPAV